jgi:HSP20 family protein
MFLNGQAREETIMPGVKEMTPQKTNGAEKAKPTPIIPEREARRAERLARRASELAFRAGSPFAFLRRFSEEMHRFLDDFGIEHGLPTGFSRMGELAEGGAEWSPHVDVSQREGKLLVRADLPGLTKDDIHVEVSDEAITIQGERKHEKKEQREGYSYSECRYGSFYRSIPLPEGADSSKVTAEFRNGVLEVVVPVPQPEQSKARKIEIQAGK